MAGKRQEKLAVCEFTVIVDSNEGHPYQFEGIKCRRTQKPLIIQTKRKPLWSTSVREVTTKRGTYRVGLADYSIEGYEDRIQIERKSLEDLFGTLGGRREKFEAEIKRLHEDCEFSCVLIEADWNQIFRWRKSGLNPESVFGTVTAWRQRFPRCHWLFNPSRAFAERHCFRILERFYRDQTEGYKA